jgi:hypothetical protein
MGSYQSDMRVRIDQTSRTDTEEGSSSSDLEKKKVSRGRGRERTTHIIF